MKSKIIELFGLSYNWDGNWKEVVDRQSCPFLSRKDSSFRKCIKVRKSQPEISIGTCSVSYRDFGVIICPFRLLERNQIFTDCLHLLTGHQPGNEIHILSEVSVPGGSVDYVLASARKREIVDFVGIELQTLDTTGTVWPERQRFLQNNGFDMPEDDILSQKSFGMNWKMTAKTILVQLHHKIVTFEHLNKHLVLVTQDKLMEYMKKQFAFDHLRQNAGDPMQIHSYKFSEESGVWRITLEEHLSTDSNGIATCLGLQKNAKVELSLITQQLEAKISDKTLLSLQT